MKKTPNEFTAPDSRQYRFQLGKRVASALSGFIAGAIFASIVWILILLYYKALL
jgi:uncharacterized RDD family membrane protein YckC